MKVLWVINITLPQVSEKMGWGKNVFGGWLSGLLECLSSKDINLVICNQCSNVKDTKLVDIGNVRHYLIAPQNMKAEIFKDILDKEQPDLVHIHGTEYRHSLEMVNAAGKDYSCVIGLQGIISECGKHYLDGVPKKYSFPSVFTFVPYFNTLFMEKRNFVLRGKSEIEALKKVENVIGRTDWDKKISAKINPNVNYFKVNESLRSGFYTQEKWNYEACEKHTIFISQASYPIKGFHQLLKVLPKIKQKYPDVKVYVAGQGIEYPETAYKKFAYDNYFQYRGYLRRLIEKGNLKDNVVFLGNLSEEQMKQRYLKSNVFISCSSIENSPNSVGEAMVLGTPIVTSNVGGVSSMIFDGVDALGYDFYDLEKLFESICKIFDDAVFATKLGEKARENAVEIFNKEQNAKALLEAYENIVS